MKYFVIWPAHGDKTWNRTRWWPTRRNLLNIKGLYNRKSAVPEKKILDRRPIYWVLCLVALALGPLIFPENQMNALLTAGATFGIFAAINVCWTLILGTASIFSLGDLRGSWHGRLHRVVPFDPVWGALVFPDAYRGNRWLWCSASSSRCPPCGSTAFTMPC